MAARITRRAQKMLCLYQTVDKHLRNREETESSEKAHQV